MTKKMYSFRFNKNLIDDAKKIAKKMDVSLSFFISYLIKEKIDSLNSKSGGRILFNADNNSGQILNEIAAEIKGLREDLGKSTRKRKMVF